MADTPGGRLLTALVDETAQSTPNQLFALVPQGPAVSDGFREATFAHLARGVNAMAWWIEENIGKATAKDTVAYMAANDIRYYIFMLACAKTGHEPFLPSTRLSDEAYEHVLNATTCHKLIYTPETQRRAMEIRAFRPNTLYIEAPSMTALLDAQTKPYPFTKTFESMENNIAFTIHSSGTTGMPKPVPLTHGFLAAWDNSPRLIPLGRKSSFYNDLAPGDLILSVTPSFHLMGMLGPFESIFHGRPFVSPPDGPLSVNVIVEMIRATRPVLAMLPPSLLQEMSHSEEALEVLKMVRYVCLGGAPLAAETGQRVGKYVKLRTAIGSSEMGLLDALAAEDEDEWNSFEWIPGYGVDMQHVGGGFYELVIVRNENARAYQGIFHTFPHLDEYHTKDLFVQLPSNPNRWAYHGRLDDVIVLSNGEKLNPTSLEKIVEGHPTVSRVLLVGEKRFQSALLIQPLSTDIKDENEFIDSLWPTIQRANETVPKYGRVLRNQIRLSSPDKPFELTPKGTTKRRAVNSDYSEEIDAIYATAAENEVESLPSVIDLPNMIQWVHGKVAALLERPDINETDDIYAAGLDSLQTVQLATALNRALSRTITQQQIYSNPSITQLAEFILTVLSGREVTGISRTERISNLVSKHTEDLPSPSQQPPTPPTQTVILTGSTGSLGTYLLNTLCQDPTTTKIYCLNRSDAQERQITSFKEKGLDASPLSNPSRVEFLTTTLSEKTFGLDQSKYNTLLESVTLVIHNAWTVNFNHPVESFEPHIKSVRNFVDFSLQSKYRAHVAFVSSVGTIGAWKPNDTESAVPEEAMETPSPVLEQGYGESKHVSERICLEASRRSNVPTSILRVGQIAGPTSTAGLWNPHEWVPILLKTSASVRAVPDGLGGYGVDWIPVDTLATITLEILHTRLAQTQSSQDPQTLAAFFHLLNPVKKEWSSLLPSIESSLSTLVTAVPLKSWLKTLEDITNPSDEDLTSKPALKLLPFFHGLASGQSMGSEISTQKAQAASQSMAGLKGIDGSLMSNWIRQWGF